MLRLDGTTVLYCYVLLLEFEANLKVVIIDDHSRRHQKSIHCLSRGIIFVLIEAEHYLGKPQFVTTSMAE